METKTSNYTELMDSDIDFIINRYKQQQLENARALIDPEAYVSTASESFDNHFMCKVCQCVVIDPEECSECQNTFCKECIRHWIRTENSTYLEGISSGLSNNPKCPTCKAVYKGVQLHRYLRNKLYEFKFKCAECEKDPE